MAKQLEVGTIPHPRVIAKDLLNCFDCYDMLTFMRSQMGDNLEYQTSLEELDSAARRHLNPRNITDFEPLEMMELDNDFSQKGLVRPIPSPLWRVVSPINKAVGLAAESTPFELEGQVSEEVAKLVGRLLIGGNRRAFMGLWFVDQDGIDKVKVSEVHEEIGYFITRHEVKHGLDNFVRLNMLAVNPNIQRTKRQTYHLTDSPLWDVFRILSEVLPN